MTRTRSFVKLLACIETAVSLFDDVPRSSVVPAEASEAVFAGGK